MLIGYEDVKSRINEEPKWYTTHGYPRYCDFGPRETGVYVKFALLVEIQCQSCHQPFLIGEGYNRENWNAVMRDDKENFMNDINKIVKHYHYGDPPNHGCVGDTMNCDDIRFIEVWEQQYNTEKRQQYDGQEYTVMTSMPEWVRRTDLEKNCEYWDNLEEE